MQHRRCLQREWPAVTIRAARPCLAAFLPKRRSATISIWGRPSIKLGIEDQSALATCPWGYSCAYVNSVSWSGPTKPLPHEANPQVVFERLFGDGGNPQERQARRQAKASLLDAVTQEVHRLNNKLPGTDRARLDEYLEDIREIERRMHNVRKASDP